jgi:hypothetical protein
MNYFLAWFAPPNGQRDELCGSAALRLCGSALLIARDVSRILTGRQTTRLVMHRPPGSPGCRDQLAGDRPGLIGSQEYRDECDL